MTNGITDPRDPDFIPYYQRQGLDAEGVSSEFMETWRKKSSEILARTRPESREAVRIGLGEFAQGQYANLKSYEMREVRRGKVDAITQGAEEAAVRTAWSVCGQAAADLRAREKEREDAQKEYDEVARTFPRSFVDVMPDPQDKANAERWLKEAAARRDERLKQADEAFAASARNRFFEAVQGIEDAGRQFDAGVAEILFDEREGAARKRKAARAAIGGVVGSLIEGGSLDVAERFVDSLENEKDVDGKSPVAMRYGFLPDDIGKMREAVKSARVRAKAESERALREARVAVGRDFTRRELELRDVPQELWADEYDEMGKDEALKDADPERAMAYRDTAAKLRAAAAKAKEAESKAREKAAKDAVEENEENLARSLATFELLKMDGSLPQDDANETQAAIWRKFRTLSLEKGLSPSFMQTFLNRLSGQLTNQEANAMRKFYQAFGYSADLDKGGEPTATGRTAAKKDSESYYAPLEEDGKRVESRKTRIKAADLLKYGDTLLRTLRALGPDMNREGVVDREITRLKTRWIKGELDENRDATVRSMMDMQREARTRWEAARPDKRSNDDDSRREDGNASK